jgi:ATP-dependent Clp protease ATP-binding subunit ClpA
VIRFTEEARKSVNEAKSEARAASSKCMEAEHILLALSEQQRSDSQKILKDAGLSPQVLREAVSAEFERSLAAIGVSIDGLNLEATAAKAKGRMQWGASARAALERAVAVATNRSEKRMGTTHLLVGVLAAREGTVPRMLSDTGVNIEELAGQAERALDRVAIR